jgi:hypothetical protein
MEWRITGDAGVVDQNFYWPKIGFNLCDSSRAGVIIGDVPLIETSA